VNVSADGEAVLSSPVMISCLAGSVVCLCDCWQLASSTLDASAKIYAGRVDAIHTEMYRVLSGLGRGASGSQKSPG